MLTKTLIQALQGDERATDQLCIQFRYIAVAYLRSKAKSKDFLLDHLYKNIDDLALDCIADLFGRSNQCLQSIEAFLTLDQIKEMSESEVQTKVRQLIFSKVNDGLYQNFQKLDPSLSRIIRNLKRKLDEDKVAGLNYDPRSGEIVISGENHSLPNMPDEILEIKISARFSEIKNSVDAIKALAFIIREAEEYSSKIKLVNFAVL
ncbi:MAG TPA: hypothetical protein DD671_00510, partial [Balneolaceae bacterium]|nr:hypothetical protein [Balneolaceae bacterium]